MAYIIDLGDDNAPRLRADFLVWTSYARGRAGAKGRRTSGRSAAAGSGVSPGRTAAVHAWAWENGHEVDRWRSAVLAGGLGGDGQRSPAALAGAAPAGAGSGGGVHDA